MISQISLIEPFFSVMKCFLTFLYMILAASQVAREVWVGELTVRS